jgi:hypothetical protein
MSDTDNQQKEKLEESLLMANGVLKTLEDIKSSISQMEKNGLDTKEISSIKAETNALIKKISKDLIPKIKKKKRL